MDESTSTLLNNLEIAVQPYLEKGGVLVVSVQHRDGEEGPAGEGRGALVTRLGWGTEGLIQVIIALFMEMMMTTMIVRISALKAGADIVPPPLSAR